MGFAKIWPRSEQATASHPRSGPPPTHGLRLAPWLLRFSSLAARDGVPATRWSVPPPGQWNRPPRGNPRVERPRVPRGHGPVPNAGAEVPWPAKPVTTSQPARHPQQPLIAQLVALLLRGGPRLLAIDDPLRAEMWATSMLGLVRTAARAVDQDAGAPPLEETVGLAVVDAATWDGTRLGLAMLRALGAVAAHPFGTAASEAAAALAAKGIADPAWAEEIGQPEVLGAWEAGGQTDRPQVHYSAFRYAGRGPHLLTCVYGAADRRGDATVVDCFVGLPGVDARLEAEQHLGLALRDVEPGTLAARVLTAIEAGDDSDAAARSEKFIQTRALAVARMRLLARSHTAANPVHQPETLH